MSYIKQNPLNDITLVGHPFAPIGMGEHLRSNFEALKANHVNANVFDIYGMNGDIQDQYPNLEAQVTKQFSAINIWHINGDEILQAIEHVGKDVLSKGYHIIHPVWELEKYPHIWAKNLRLFDEIWSASNFSARSIERALGSKVHNMPLASEPRISRMLSRRYFNLPDSDYLFLSFWDSRSFSKRKNPEAVLAAFGKFRKENPYARAKLVLKVNPIDGDEFVLNDNHLFQELKEDICLFYKTLSDNEMKNLVRVVDCFVSLHRSEGFGRGMSEAAFWGKSVIATNYSGNVDFLDETCGSMVPYTLINLEEGDYPHWEGQKWADPDIGVAAQHMSVAFKNPPAQYDLRLTARRRIRKKLSYFTIGRNIINRLAQIGRDQ